MHDVNRLTDHLFRHESGKMVAVLTRLFGFPNYDLARDIVQDTLLAALSHWRLHGIPDNPTGWLYTVAKNKTVDWLRKQKNTPQQSLDWATVESTLDEQEVDALFLEHEIHDSVLRMMFACGHPSLSAEAQLALILRTLCGLSVGEIARAFLSNEETIQKRLYRTKEKIRAEGISLEVPTGTELSQRVEGVRKAVYLLFNEGYNSQSVDWLVKEELCTEAIRLGGLLCSHPLTSEPASHALLALMYFQASRLATRLDTEGQIVLLEQQDRTRWNQPYIQKGKKALDCASEGPHLSEYHLQAGIAYYHATAERFESTNWQAITYLYHLLVALNPSPMVYLSRAIAIGFAQGAERGIEELKNITTLSQNHYYYVALGDFHAKCANVSAAIEAYRQALHWCVSAKEKALIAQKIAALSV